ncbi:MAG: hypothetical protein ACKOE2_02920 [Actinomycetales bacterium]
MARASASGTAHAGGRADFAVTRSRSEGSRLREDRLVCSPLDGGPVRSGPIRGATATVTRLLATTYACSVQARNDVGSVLGDPVLISGRR